MWEKGSEVKSHRVSRTGRWEFEDLTQMHTATKMRIPKLRDQFLLLLKAAVLTERRSKIVCKIKARRERSAEGRRKGHRLTGSEKRFLRANIMLGPM